MKNIEERFLLLTFGVMAPTMFLAVAVALGGFVVPILQETEDFKTLSSEASNAFLFAILSLALMAAGALLLPIGQVLLFRRYVTRPLERLMFAAERMEEEGLPGKAEVERVDEVGRVVSVYNDMVDQLVGAMNDLKLQERVVALGEISTGLLHEIRNPLAVIVGNCDLLAREIEDPSQKTLLLRIRQEALSLKEWSHRILDFARPLHLARSSFPVRPLLEEVVQNLSSLPEVRDHRIQMTLDETPLQVLGDRDALKQVLLDIALNGLESMSHSKGTLTCGAVSDGDHTLIWIKDNGCGIPAQDLDHIFEPFFTQKEDGTGLGLSMACRVIEALHGEIEVESVQEEGTRVLLRLPASEWESTEAEGLKEGESRP